MLKKYLVCALLALVAHLSSQEIQGVETEQFINGISLSKALETAADAIQPAFGNSALSQAQLDVWNLLEDYPGQSSSTETYKMRTFLNVCFVGAMIDQYDYNNDPNKKAKQLFYKALVYGDSYLVQYGRELPKKTLSHLIGISKRLNPEKTKALDGIEKQLTMEIERRSKRELEQVANNSKY